MMAGLVQEQASVAQPGTKDDFADTIRRVRQVNVGRRTRARWFRSTISGLCMWSVAEFWSGTPGSYKQVLMLTAS